MANGAKLFADDTTFFCTGDDFKSLAKQKEMVKLKKWFDENKLSLNLNKTKLMIFGHQRREANIFADICAIYIFCTNNFKADVYFCCWG